jgi:hypothetical protein
VTAAQSNFSKTRHFKASGIQLLSMPHQLNCASVGDAFAFAVVDLGTSAVVPFGDAAGRDVTGAVYFRVAALPDRAADTDVHRVVFQAEYYATGQPCCAPFSVGRNSAVRDLKRLAVGKGLGDGAGDDADHLPVPPAHPSTVAPAPHSAHHDHVFFDEHYGASHVVFDEDTDDGGEDGEIR